MKGRAALHTLLLAGLTLLPVPATAQAAQGPAMTGQGMVLQGRALLRFGPLVWVYAAPGLPERVNGRTVVPLAETCDLLGLTCTAEEAGAVTVNGVPVTRAPGGGTGARVELRALAAAAHLPLTFDAASGLAVLPLPETGAAHDLAAALEERNVTLSATAPQSPLTVGLGASVLGRPYRSLSVTFKGAGTSLMTLAARVNGQGSTLTGDGLGSSPDVQPGAAACSSTACTALVDRASSVALAVITPRP